MATEPTAQKWSAFTKSGKWWLIGFGVMFAVSYPLGWYDSATELTPDHSNVLVLGFILALLVAVISAPIMWRATFSWPLKNRIGFSVACTFFGFLATIVAFLPASEIVEGWIDFPPSRTVTYDHVLVMISRAYQTHGKSRSWNIQTMPIWSNIDITQKDYNGMLSHRSPEDGGSILMK